MINIEHPSIEEYIVTLQAETARGLFGAAQQPSTTEHSILTVALDTAFLANRIAPTLHELDYDLVFNWGSYEMTLKETWSLLHHSDDDLTMRNIATHELLTEYASLVSEEVHSQYLILCELDDDDFIEAYEGHVVAANTYDIISANLLEEVAGNSTLAARITKLRD